MCEVTEVNCQPITRLAEKNGYVVFMLLRLLRFNGVFICIELTHDFKNKIEP